jgi:hypothetical protein
LARYDLGLSDGEFGQLNPAAFDALLSRKWESEKRSFLRAGIVAAAIYNANPFRDKNAKAVNPLDFVPDDKPKGNQLEAQIKAVSAAFGCGPGKPEKPKTKTEKRK